MPATTAAKVTVELEEETRVLLEALAERTGEKEADLLRNALRNGMQDMDEYFSAAATIERLDNGTERTFSAADVRRELGLDD